MEVLRIPFKKQDTGTIGSKSARKLDVRTSGTNARWGEVALIAVAFPAWFYRPRRSQIKMWKSGRGTACGQTKALHAQVLVDISHAANPTGRKSNHYSGGVS